MNLNKAFILGRLTAEPELRATPSGQQVCSFSLATNTTWSDKKGQKQENAEYHNIVVWGKQAEVAKSYLHKSDLCLVEGKIQTRSWMGKDGSRRKTQEIIAERIQIGPRNIKQEEIKEIEMESNT